MLHALEIRRTFIAKRSSRDDGSASCRETPAFIARADTAGAGLGRTEQEVVDGFARSAPNLCHRFREWDGFGTKRSPRHSVGCGRAKRRTPFYHRRRGG